MKVVRYERHTYDGVEALLALCEDGSVFAYKSSDRQWTQTIPAIGNPPLPPESKSGTP
jgi:hypothetical protein